MNKGAVISDCGNYRYQLWRIWDENLPCLLFIMLNPSTADAEEDDPTIRRCIQFASSWGYGGIYVGNLFAWRSSKPQVLKYLEDPVGPDNATHVGEMSAKCKIVVAAWGNNVPKGVHCRSLERLQANALHYLALSKTGNPKHPLYLPGHYKPLKLAARSGREHLMSSKPYLQ